MKISCSIIRDLLPLYAEQMVSEETAVLVEEHLAECPACAEELAVLQPGQVEVREAFSDQPFMEEAVPLKKVKRRLLRKNVLIALTAVLIVVALFFCQILFTPFDMNYGTSERYSHSEMDHAALAVKLNLGVEIGWCRLLTLNYSGDKASNETLKHINTYDSPEKPYTDCIVFDSTFRAPPMGHGNWSPSEIVSWPWVLARRGHGPWVVIFSGY